ncbi:MAG: hypothetical protein KatS3mg103_0530 [Phycisphaerales bacterium]|nr:MAG: hypothetical protein KatS3mg103_0530 [Phycisphaerales bacterium]
MLLKLGTYGIYRFVLGFVPEAVVAYAPTLAVLSIVGILYAGLICWVQRDVKKLVAYSSVSHLGFCVLGLVALNNVGLTGSVLYMINHGLSTGAMFLCIGMVYERFHTRSMDELGGLASTMPIWSSFMVFFVMASVGLPGLNGFVSEFMCIVGTFQSSPAWVLQGLPGAAGGTLGPAFAFAAALGVIVAAMYLLYMTGPGRLGRAQASARPRCRPSPRARRPRGQGPQRPGDRPAGRAGRRLPGPGRLPEAGDRGHRAVGRENPGALPAAAAPRTRHASPSRRPTTGLRWKCTKGDTEPPWPTRSRSSGPRSCCSSPPAW